MSTVRTAICTVLLISSSNTRHIILTPENHLIPISSPCHACHAMLVCHPCHTSHHEMCVHTYIQPDTHKVAQTVDTEPEWNRMEW